MMKTKVILKQNFFAVFFTPFSILSRRFQYVYSALITRVRVNFHAEYTHKLIYVGCEFLDWFLQYV